MVHPIVPVFLLELSDLVDHAQNDLKASANGLRRKALGAVAEGVVVVGQNRVLGRKGDGFDPRPCHGGAVAAAHGVVDAAAGDAFDVQFLEGVLEHLFQVLIEAGELPVVLDDHFKIPLVRDGIDVDVPIKFCEQDSERRFGEYEICLNKGYQHLNGEQALAFARHRHSLLRGDIDRTKHQQLVIEAIAKKMLKKVSFSDFKDILDSISDNIATNIETEQILSFYDTIKQMLLNSLNGEDLITIEKTYLEYYDLPIYTSYGYMSAIGYYDSSLEAIKDAMKMNLGLKKIIHNKSFSYDYNQEYEQKIIGKGLTNGNTIETLPEFRGQTISDVINWVGDKDIIVNYEYVDHTNIKYNSLYEIGYIANQSIPSRTRVSSIKELTIYINK